MKFKIEITETLQRIVEVEANNLSEAISKVADTYDNEEIVLDYNDLVGFSIKEAADEKRT